MIENIKKILRKSSKRNILGSIFSEYKCVTSKLTIEKYLKNYFEEIIETNVIINLLHICITKNKTSIELLNLNSLQII